MYIGLEVVKSFEGADAPPSRTYGRCFRLCPSTARFRLVTEELYAMGFLGVAVFCILVLVPRLLHMSKGQRKAK